VGARWLDTSDADAWRAALPASRSAFGSLELARALERSGGPRGALLVAQAGGASCAWPFAIQPLEELPFPPPAALADAVDVATPPFTGPYEVHAGGVEELALLADALDSAFAERRVVAAFSHLHPFVAEHGLVADPEPDREIVWVDTTLDPERLWRESYSKACRKNVNRAEREGVTVRPAESEDDVARLHEIYLTTMERNEAHDSYFFPLERFLAIWQEMPDNARFSLAEHDGRVVAGTVYLHDDQDVYSYLGGADHEQQHVRPTNAIVHDTIAWARQQGKRRLILGGGYRPDDGIFRFKASFSPERATLRLARRIHMRGEYEALVAAWRAHHGAGADPQDFFPAYRAEPS
jgi:hypothetical protein